MTFSQEQRDEVDSYHLGVNGYVVKPVDFDQFSKASQTWAVTGCIPSARRQVWRTDPPTCCRQKACS